VNSYTIPQGSGDKSWEEKYQIVVANALATATGPVLVKPRAKYRGWCWNVYRK